MTVDCTSVSLHRRLVDFFHTIFFIKIYTFIFLLLVNGFHGRNLEFPWRMLVAKCVIAKFSSQVGSAEHSARLNVYGLPFIRHMDKKAIVAGETLRVTCPVAGYPIESIVWERDTRVLPINRKQKVFPNGTLIIENVERMSDQATYTCVARNAQGYSARGTLEVQVMGKFKILFPYAISRVILAIELIVTNFRVIER